MESSKRESVKDTVVVNFFGGPGVGKSGRMHEVVSALKPTDLCVEMASEYAKEVVWQEPPSPEAIKNQVHVFGEQHNRIFRLLGKVDVIATDAPLLHSIVYARLYDEVYPDSAFFESMVFDEFEKLDTINVFLQRDAGDYSTDGRFQTLDEARRIDQEVERVLNDSVASYEKILMDGPVLDTVLEQIENRTRSSVG